jgi:hypothetical protein
MQFSIIIYKQLGILGYVNARSPREQDLKLKAILVRINKAISAHPSANGCR